MLCKHEVVGSIPSGSTSRPIAAVASLSRGALAPTGIGKTSSETFCSPIAGSTHSFACVQAGRPPHRGIIDIVKRDLIRLPFRIFPVTRRGSGWLAFSVLWASLTAVLSDRVEANWSFGSVLVPFAPARVRFGQPCRPCALPSRGMRAGWFSAREAAGGWHRS